MPTPTPFFTWPDGATEMVETFTETTAFETSYNGTEHASVGRAGPRYQVEAGFTLFDDARAGPSGLDGESPLLVPAWMHPLSFSGGFARPDAIHGESASALFMSKNNGGGTSQLSTPVLLQAGALRLGSWPAGVLLGYPLVPMHLSADSFDVSVVSRKVETTNLAFVTDTLFEPLPAYTGPTSAGLPLLARRNDWKTPPVKTRVFSQNKFDNGNLQSRKNRFTKNGVDVRFELFGRAEIIAFRLFLRQLRGKFGVFRWAALDGVERSYRLSSDTWSLRYRGTHYASTTLRFIEVS